MRTLRTAIVAIAVVLAATSVAAQYPEYVEGRPTPAAAQPYSLPDFGNFNPRWVQYWNAAGFYAETHWNPVYSCWVQAGDYDGVAYDGRLIANAKPQDGKVPFAFEGEEPNRFFYEHQLSDDPRLTNWWMAFACDSSATLWEAVERAAMTEEYPALTRAIIRHMEQCGFVNLSQVNTMTSAEIRTALVEYTDVALAHNASRTRELVGRNRLTRERFGALKVGDRLELYYRSRFGPTPHKCETLEVAATGDTLKLRFEGDQEAYGYTWDNFARVAPFVAVRH